MANKAAPFTFHRVREECPQASEEAWRAFFNLYGPLGVQLLAMYAAGDSPAWEQTVEALRQNDFERFRGMPQKSEREFLMELRAELLERAQSDSEAMAGTEMPEGGAAGIDLERIAAILEGLPLLHQEIVWFKLAGYTDATLERVLRVAPQMGRVAVERVTAEFSAIGALQSDRCPWPRRWLTLLHQARAAKKEDCPTLHQMLRIHDGQVSWYDKEPLEKRVGSCVHCLENWTGLREVGYWRMAAPAVSAELTEKWLGRVHLAEAKKKSFFQRASR